MTYVIRGPAPYQNVTISPVSSLTSQRCLRFCAHENFVWLLRQNSEEEIGGTYLE